MWGSGSWSEVSRKGSFKLSAMHIFFSPPNKLLCLPLVFVVNTAHTCNLYVLLHAVWDFFFLRKCKNESAQWYTHVSPAKGDYIYKQFKQRVSTKRKNWDWIAPLTGCHPFLPLRPQGFASFFFNLEEPKGNLLLFHLCFDPFPSYPVSASISFIWA